MMELTGNNMKNGTQSKVDIAVLHERVHSIDSRLEKIETNDLPHLHDKLHGIEVKLAYYSGGIVVSIAIVEAAIRYFSS